MREARAEVMLGVNLADSLRSRRFDFSTKTCYLLSNDKLKMFKFA